MSEFSSLIFYVAVFSVSAFFFSLYKREEKLIRRMGLFLSIIVPSTVAGLRYGVGTDWGNYSYNMTLIRTISFSDVFHHSVFGNSEYGFLVVVKFLSFFFNNELIFGFFAFATLAFVANALITEYVEYDITVAYFMFLFVYFGNSFNLMRQTLAAAVVFWGMRFVYRREIGKYLITVFFASSVHFTALISVPIYVLWNKKQQRALDNKYFITMAVAAFAVVLTWKSWLKLLLSSGFAFLQKYSVYLNENNARNRDFFVKILVFILIFILYHSTAMKSERLKMHLQMGTVNLLISLTGFYVTFLKRAGMYYEIPVIILISALTKGFSTNSRLPANILSAVLIVSYFTLVYYIIGDSGIIPYQIVSG